MVPPAKWLTLSSLSWKGLRWGAALVSIAAHGAAASLAWMAIDAEPPTTIEAFTVELVSADRLEGAAHIKRSVSAPVPVDNAERKSETAQPAETAQTAESAAARASESSPEKPADSGAAPGIEIDIARAAPVKAEETLRDPVPAASTRAVAFPPPPVKPARPTPRRDPKPAERHALRAMPDTRGQNDAAPGAVPSEGETVPMTAASYSVGSLGNKPPDYPERARRNAFEGRVIVRVQVSAAGTSESARVIESSGYDILDEAARAAVMQWTFVPAKRAGVAVAAGLDVPIVFRLTENTNR
ncbi:MAG: energy transducer TonB [Rhodospirillales bacterium]